MWLIKRGTDGLGEGRIGLPPPLRAALTRWYSGGGTGADEAAGITLVQQARIGGKWLACGCLGTATAPPILTAAYLSNAETYYLRRLTGPNRPGHRLDCPFFRDQATAGVDDLDAGRPPSPPPDGYFEALRPAPEKLAQRPEADAVDDRTRHGTLPRLGRLLRRLLLVSGRTCLLPGEREPTISSELAAVRAAAARIEVAPGIDLGRMLWTHVDAYHSGRAAAAVKRLSANWPRGHAPQGFLLIYARAIHGQLVVPADGAPLRIANRVQSPSTRAHELTGPYLVLVVIGQYPEAKDVAPLRAFAQPIVSGRCFVPIDDHAERSLVRHLRHAQTRLASKAIDLAIEKPVFDTLTGRGACRPDLRIRASNGAGARRSFFVHIMGDHQIAPADAGLNDFKRILAYDPAGPASAFVDRLVAALLR